MADSAHYKGINEKAMNAGMLPVIMLTGDALHKETFENIGTSKVDSFDVLYKLVYEDSVILGNDVVNVVKGVLFLLIALLGYIIATVAMFIIFIAAAVKGLKNMKDFNKLHKNMVNSSQKMCVAAMVGLFIGGLSLTGLIATLIVVILVSLMNGVCARIFTMRVLSDEQNKHFSITQIASVIGIICAIVVLSVIPSLNIVSGSNQFMLNFWKSFGSEAWNFSYYYMLPFFGRLLLGIIFATLLADNFIPKLNYSIKSTKKSKNNKQSETNSESNAFMVILVTLIVAIVPIVYMILGMPATAELTVCVVFSAILSAVQIANMIIKRKLVRT